MENIFDRLQFVKGLNPSREDGIFNTREDAINYVLEKQISDRPTVVAEPIVLRYESDSATKGPNVILAIGSVGVGKPTYANRTFFIDTQKTEEEIIALDEKIENAIKSLAIMPLESDTIKLHAEKTDEGTVLSGDVKIADYRIAEGKVNYNIIQKEENKGIYAFVDMDYNPETFVITFNVNGVTKEFQLPEDQHVISGLYKPEDESIYLKLADGSKVKIGVQKLIEEWTVLPDGQTINEYNISGTTVKFTPVVFAKTHVGSKATEHEGIYEWQDVLEADVRVADHINDNILHKDRTGRYLYVKGTADNISYKDGLTVKDALDNVDTKISTSTGNLIYKRPDGIYATAMLGYNTAENKLTYTYSDGNSGEIKEVEFKLNSVKILEDITYDPVKEVLVIRYIDAQGEYQKVEIPAKDIIEEWDVNNEAHNIKLNKYRSEGAGKDILSADAKLHRGDNNIIVDLNHELYVNGISDNIKYDVTGLTTVKDVLDSLSATTEALDIKINKEATDRIADVNEEQERAETAEQELNAKIDKEISDRESEIERIDNTIGTGFTSDPHENVTAKFEQLTDKVNSEIERSIEKDSELENAINAEVARSTEKDEEHDNSISNISTTIGSGFSTDAHETVTYKFEQLGEKVIEEEERAKSEEHRIEEKLDAEIERSTSKDTEHDGRLDSIDAEIGEGFGPRNTVRDEIDGLQNEIEAISAESATKLKDIVNEDHSIDVDKTDPTIPVIKVNLSSEVEDNKQNIIKLNSDGLYAGVDLIYEFNEQVGSNQLIFKTTNGTKVYDLKTNSVVDKIYYDASREAIIIEYTVNGHRMPDVVIPVGDLINEWRVWDGHEGAIQLEKTRIPSGTTEQDILKASVVISDTHDDNIIFNDNGALYVPGGQIEQNKEDIAALKERVALAENDIDTLEGNLANEIARATSEEGRIEEKINNEISRSTQKDSDIESALNSEITRSTQKDQEIIDLLNGEISRATSAETALQTSIDNEATRAINREDYLEHLIGDEKDNRLSGDTQLRELIDDEKERARDAENRIENSISDEINRAIAKENELNLAITNEALRAQSADNELYQKIADEKTLRVSSDSELDSKIEQEISRATVIENVISGAIQSEITRSTAEDQAIRDLLTVETTARQEGDAELEQMILDATLTFSPSNDAFVSNGTIQFNRPDLNNNVVEANVLLPQTDNIIITDNNGLRANVELIYNAATNTLTLEKTDGLSGKTYDVIELNAGSIINSIVYDNESRELVIKYQSTSDPEHQEKEVRVGVSDLFNPWIEKNLTEKSAIELKKTYRTSPLGEDELSARILITDDHDGDGKPDQGSDNVIEIRNNGLYVNGSALSGAVEIAECVKDELKVFETAVIGHVIGQECGNGYRYEPNNTATYINSATSFNNADYILDQAIKNVDFKVDVVSAKTDCVDGKTEKLYELLYGQGASINNCGESLVYQPYVGACIISGATSFNEADQMLNDRICGIYSMWTSGRTCSTESTWSEDGTNRKMEVDVRLSHGKFVDMSDDELVIRTLDGDYIDPTRTEFTDTNALRIVCVSEGPSGITPSVESKQNGIYLSNAWDCGLYYDNLIDVEAKAAAEAAGYNTNYSVDNKPESMNYNYMNNIRQTDI